MSFDGLVNSQKSDEYPSTKHHIVFNQRDMQAECLEEITSADDPGHTYSLKHILTGKMRGYVFNEVNVPPTRASLSFDYLKKYKTATESEEGGGPIFGKMYGCSHKSILQLLKESKNATITQAPESLNGISCYKIEGEGRYGRVTAWIAQGNERNLLKWTILKQRDDYFDEAVVGDIGIKQWEASFEVTKLQQINDQSLPQSAVFKFEKIYDNGKNIKYEYKYEIKDINLNPDFEAIGAFKIDLPDGTPIYIDDIPGIKYVWRDGKPVTDVDQSFLDVLDSEIKQIKSGQEPNSPMSAKTEQLLPAANKCNVPEVNDAKQSDADNAVPLTNKEKPNYATIVVIVILVAIVTGTIIYKFRRKQANV
ncbi:MAG TPA: hypothetical protein DDW84_03830 [Phycisphaerales bacterium]|nr:hypothetical protein [Phycisphaerales bacterium]